MHSEKKHARRMSGGAPLSPNQVLKNQRDNPGRVTNWTGPPHHKKLRGQRKNSGEREDPALQNKNLKRQKRPDRRSQTREREPRQTPGENTQGKTGKKSIRTQTMERTGRPNPQGNLKSFLEGRRHWIRQ